MPRATEVERLEQDMGGAVAKRVLEFVDHQPVAVTAETLQGNGRACHIPAQALQLSPIAGLASKRPSKPAPDVRRRNVLRRRSDENLKPDR